MEASAAGGPLSEPCISFTAYVILAAETPQNGITVAEVRKMLDNAISEDVIVAKLRKAKTSMDLSTDEMVALKKAGASSNLLKIMIDPGSVDTAPSATSARNTTEEDVDSFNLYDGDKKIPLQEAALELNTKVTGAVIVTGGARAYMTLSKSGPTAAVRTTNAAPRFGELEVPLNLRIQELVQLVKLEINGDKHRRWESAKGGGFTGVKMSNKNAVELAFEEVGKRNLNGKQVRLFIAKPVTPLAPGEYGIVISMQHCYDFGIDSSTK